MTKRTYIDVRPAVNADGIAIKNLCLGAGFNGLEAVSFAEVAPHWLVASRKNETEIIGAIEVLLGKPIGRLELMCFNLDLNKVEKAKVFQQLMLHGMATLKAYGSSMVSGLIPHGHKTYKNIFKNRGGVVLASGNMLAKRLI